MEYKIITMNHEVDGVHLSKIVWDASRANSDVQLKEVIGVDAPHNEFASVVLEIKSSIIIREIIASIREHTMWATSSRVDDPVNFKVDPLASKAAIESAEKRRILMQDAKEDGDMQDSYRMHLPLISTTKYSVRLSMRACAVLRSFFYRMALDCHDGLAAIYRSAEEAFTEICHDMGMVARTGYVNLLHGPVYGEDCVSRDNGFISIRFTAPFSMRTHLIRHRLLMMRDDFSFWAMGIADRMCIGDDLKIAVCATEDSWARISEKRSCWIAQPDIWKPLLDKVQSVRRLGPDLLPCKDGACPYEKDVMLRLEGKDPNAPCPRHAAMNDYKLSESEMAAVDRDIKTNNRPSFWRNPVG